MEGKLDSSEAITSKDQGYSWVVLTASLVSYLITGISTFGSISVLTYVWIEMFTISPDTAAWASAIMSATLALSGM